MKATLITRTNQQHQLIHPLQKDESTDVAGRLFPTNKEGKKRFGEKLKLDILVDILNGFQFFNALFYALVIIVNAILLLYYYLLNAIYSCETQFSSLC